jgi:FdhD protein
MSRTPTARYRIWNVDNGASRRRREWLATEEPLEIRLQAGGAGRTLALTMRTPGHDYELAAGFLHGEGVIANRHALIQMTYCAGEQRAQQAYNTLMVTLNRARLPDLPQLERHFFTNSACGVCGATMLDDLTQRTLPALPANVMVAADVLRSLPEQMHRQQALFLQTGGLHAAALFDLQGNLIELREDVGRHNALDKLVGWGLLNDRLPFSDKIILVSGRASYELLQKCVVAGAPIFCAISAPSSLSVAVAQQFGVTLVGFLRGARCNVYTHAQRLGLAGA